MEQLLQGDEPPTRSMEMMQEAGERLNIDEMVVNELISPDEVVVFRILIGLPEWLLDGWYPSSIDIWSYYTSTPYLKKTQGSATKFSNRKHNSQ